MVILPFFCEVALKRGNLFFVKCEKKALTLKKKELFMRKSI